MLIRERILLQLLRAAGRAVSRVELVKWAFLLRQDRASVVGETFYEFLPHRRGPYSFVLRREMDRLVADGIVSGEGETWEWIRSESASGLPAEDARTVASVCHRYREIAEGELLDDVYRRFPEFTMCSDTRPLTGRPTGTLQVHTCGDEGVSIDGFLWLLIRSGIRRLVDVRRNPIARRYGFHKTTLALLCREVGIEYRHLPELGIASEHRKGDSAFVSRDDLLAWYESEHLPTVPAAVQEVAESVARRPTAVMCQEANPCECHRSRLAHRVAELTGLPVAHLRPSS